MAPGLLVGQCGEPARSGALRQCPQQGPYLCSREDPNLVGVLDKGVSLEASTSFPFSSFQSLLGQKPHSQRSKVTSKLRCSVYHKLWMVVGGVVPLCSSVFEKQFSCSRKL